MRVLHPRRRELPFPVLPHDPQSVLRRKLREAAGLLLLAAALGTGIALATWSAQDPSFSYATGRPASNLLGFPGAAVADLLMQLIGFAAIPLVLTLIVWGWRLLRQQRIGLIRLRLLMWFAGLLALAFAASFLPVTAGWPLPSGLGGAIGDLLHRTLTMLGITGDFADGIGVVVGATGLALLFVASGVPMREREPEPELDPADEPVDEPRERFVSLGLLTHWALSAPAQFRRFGNAILRRERRAPISAMSELLRRADSAPEPVHHEEPAWEQHEYAPPAQRREAAARRNAPPPPPPPFEAEDEDDPFEDAFDEPPVPVAPPPAPAKGLFRAIKPAKQGRAARAAPPPQMQPELPGLEEDGFQLPPHELLAEPKRNQGVAMSADAMDQNARALEGVLEDFGVRGQIINVKPGPVVTLYELEPAPGIKSSRVIGLADDIARSMSAISARVAVVPGRNVIGIELPNPRRETVYLRELLSAESFTRDGVRLPLCLGKNIGGESIITELARMPHLLIAGTTGSGKSVAINTMILSLVYRLTPEQCRLIMIDPKMLELSAYDGIPHLLSPVVTDPKKAVIALKWAVREMEDRYRKMSKLGVRNIDGFNARVRQATDKGEQVSRTVQTGFDRETGEAVYEQEVMQLSPLPYIVVIVDEMADLMMVAGKEIEGAIQRLAQMARAAGIHIIMATQRPSVDVITGTIKANFPTRISFQVTSKIDSRTILGEQGAEQLLGQGDMLYMAGGGRISRVHGPFVSDEEVEQVVAYLKTQGAPDYLDSITVDQDEAPADEDSAVFDKGSFGEEGADVYDQAVAVVLRDKKCSTSYIQRRLQIGYNRAASLVERMEREGVVGPANHAGKREILLETEDAD